jgi:hypothetical protein
MKRFLCTIILLLILLPGMLSYSLSQTCVVNVPQVGQIESQWCWAACSQSILGYYGVAATQPDIANWACLTNGNWCVPPQFCGDCLCIPHPCATCCNRPNYLYDEPEAIDGILMNFGGIGSFGLDRAMTQAEIIEDVCPPYCKPWIIRWGWIDDGGHFLVGHGYDVASTNVWYMNPLPMMVGSKNIALYAWVVAGGGHLWTHSLRLVPPGPTAVEFANISVSGSNGYVDIQWTTEVEMDIAGFNIHRSGMENGEYAKINEELIPAMGSTVEGASYSYTDHDVVAGNTYYYLLESVDLNGNSTMEGPIAVTLGMTEVAEGPNDLIPDAFGLSQNYPNPFNVETDIRYRIPDVSFVALKIYNILGQEIVTLEEGTKEAGYNIVHWNGTDITGQDVPSGVYVYRIMAGNWSDTKRMVLLK